MTARVKSFITQTNSDSEEGVDADIINSQESGEEYDEANIVLDQGLMAQGSATLKKTKQLRRKSCWSEER